MNNDFNQPTAITSGGTKPLKAPGKSPNLKFFGIGAGIAVLLIAVGVFLLLPKDTPVRAGEFNDNASSTREVKEVKEYVSLEGFNLSDPYLSPASAEEVEAKIVDFFSLTFPEISTLTVKDVKLEESLNEEISEEENPATVRNYFFTLGSNTGSTFLAEIYVASNLSNYNLSIKSGDKELYSYSGGEITSDPYSHASDSLLDAIITELPLYGETSNGEKFDITYEGDAEDRLTLSANSDSETIKDCDATKSAAVSLVSNLTLDYFGEISEANFICE